MTNLKPLCTLVIHERDNELAIEILCAWLEQEGAEDRGDWLAVRQALIDTGVLSEPED